MAKEKKDWPTAAWAAAVIILLLLILEISFTRIEEGAVVPILSPLLDLIRRFWDTFLEILRV